MEVVLGIDVGKTNVRVGIFDLELVLLERWGVASVEVQAAMEALRGFLVAVRERFEVAGVGVSIFGPLEVEAGAEGFGAVIESSEPAWSGVNVPALVGGALGCRVYFDFDVSAGGAGGGELWGRPGCGELCLSFSGDGDWRGLVSRRADGGVRSATGAYVSAAGGG